MGFKEQVDAENAKIWAKRLKPKTTLKRISDTHQAEADRLGISLDAYNELLDIRCKQNSVYVAPVEQNDIKLENTQWWQLGKQFREITQTIIKK